MLIIIEGIDRVGKTTLSTLLEKELGFTLCKWFNMDTKEDAGNNNVFNYQVAEQLRKIDFNKKNIAIDRFHLTEYVYGIVDRGMDVKCQEKVCLNIDKKLSELKDNCCIVYVEPIDLEESSKQHGKQLYPHLMFFNDILKRISCEVIHTDFNNLQKTIEEIRKRLVYEKHRG